MIKIKQQVTHIVIVDDNTEFVDVLCEYLSMFEELFIDGIANNGLDAIEMIKTKEPDVVIMDIIMPKIDGLGVLKKVNEMNLTKKPQFIMLSAMGNDAPVQIALSLGASYFIAKPCNLSDLVLRMKQLQSLVPKINLNNNYIPAHSSNNDIKVRITDVLDKIGIFPHLKGYKYLKHAISLVYNDFSAINSVTKIIYESVATKYNTTQIRVERAIRNAIEICWSKGNIKNIDKIFGEKFNKNSLRPTNSEFIIIIIEYLRKNEIEYIL